MTLLFDRILPVALLLLALFIAQVVKAEPFLVKSGEQRLTDVLRDAKPGDVVYAAGNFYEGSTIIVPPGVSLIGITKEATIHGTVLIKSRSKASYLGIVPFGEGFGVVTLSDATNTEISFNNIKPDQSGTACCNQYEKPAWLQVQP